MCWGCRFDEFAEVALEFEESFWECVCVESEAACVFECGLGWGCDVEDGEADDA